MITLEKNGIRAGTIVAGGSEHVLISDEAALDLPAGARIVCTLTAALPPDAVHLLAATEEMSFGAWNASLSLYTVPLREYFHERRIIESLPARLEFFDLAHQTVLAACTVQVQNSRLLWGDAEAGVPSAQIGLTRADMAQLEREMSETQATVDKALAAGEETKKYAMAAASAAESARQSAAGSKRVANAAQEAAAAAQEAVNTHSARTDNPHAVTAEQVGALPLSGGKVDGTVSYVPYAPEGAISTSYDGEILAHGNVIHLTTPDSSESPSAWGSGLLSEIPGGSVCSLTVIIENTGDAAQTFTLMNDDLVEFKFNSGNEDRIPCQELAPGAFCFVNLLVWKRSSKTLAFVREYYRTDKINNAGIMSPVLFSYGGKAFRLEVDENGGLSTTLAG